MEKPPLTVVTWLWGRRYGADHVNKLYKMLKRHLHIPFNMLCLSDRPNYRIKKPVKVVPLWPNQWGKFGCWRRLFIFSENVKSLIGPRHLSIDLDTVIVDDITPIIDRQEDIVLTRTTNPNYPKHLYTGTMWLMDTGKYSKVWTKFEKEFKLKRGNIRRIHGFLKRMGFNGTDSAWISYQLGPGQPSWGEEDGIYSIVYNMEDKGLTEYPEDARIILFHGRQNDPRFVHQQEKYPWIREHWC